MYVIIYLIIYTRAVSVSSVVWCGGVLGVVWWCPRWCVGVLCGVMVESSVVWCRCPRWCGVGVLCGVMVESSVVWCRCPLWCGGGVLGGVVSVSSVVWCRCPLWCGVGVLGGVVVESSVAYIQPSTKAGTPRGSSVRRAVSLLNQGFWVEFTDAIALIINYLGAPFGCAFAEWYVG